MSLQKSVKISAVSYANTYPFLYGIEQGIPKSQIELSLDVPAVCAAKLISGEVDLGLIPVAELPKVPNAQIVSDYCIGAVGAVKTVLLMSRVPMNEIKQVYLDPESRSSVNMVRILATHFWQKDWEWLPAPEDFPRPDAHPSIVLIGDKTYASRPDYPYIYDLSAEWMKFTGKPFVFAAWVSNKPLAEDFIRAFNQALSFGLHNIDAALDVYADVAVKDELRNYLNNYISYELDAAKREGMELFLNYLKS